MGRDGRDIAIENEFDLLLVIKEQKWIREDELAALSGKSHQMVSRTIKRMAEKNIVYRDKKPAGWFVRLKLSGAKYTDGKSGKNVDIPESWRHDAVAIHAMVWLKKHLEKKQPGVKIETEASIRQRIQKGKVADGLLRDGERVYLLEQEWSRKSGKLLEKQTRSMIAHMEKLLQYIVVYPYDDEKRDEKGEWLSGCRCQGINHEHRQTVAVRKIWGDSPIPNMQFLRVKFNNNLAMDHARPSDFELIDVPPRTDAKEISIPLVDEVDGYRWQGNGLTFKGEIVDELEIIEETDDVNLQCLYHGDIIEAAPSESSQNFEIRIKNGLVLAHKQGVYIRAALKSE